MSLSEALAQFVAKTTYEDLPEDVVAFTKLCILDWFGSAIAGKESPPVQMISQMIKEMGGNPQATMITGGKSSAAQIAFVNGAASHVVELDDIHKGSIIHAATVVIPAALAVTEWKGKSGKDFITAVAVGYDVCYRIGEAVSPSHYYYWHNTATCGTFGAAATVSKLLDLEEEQIVEALGSAGTQAAGLWEFIEDGAMSKQLHPGKAAYNGTLSALLAQKGFTAAKKILEGDRGFFKAMSEDSDISRITDQLGERFKITENSFKVHASCRHTHAAVDLVLDIVKEHAPHIENVTKIQIKTYKTALDITNNPNPKSVYASKFSIQFCAALAFLNGSASLSDFDGNSLEDKQIRELMKKIDVSVGPSIEAAYPKEWGAEVEIFLENGTSYGKQTKYPKGDPENPVSSVELQEKFKDLTRASLGERVSHIVEQILTLEKFGEVGFLKLLEDGQKVSK